MGPEREARYASRSPTRRPSVCSHWNWSLKPFQSLQKQVKQMKGLLQSGKLPKLPGMRM